MKTLKFKLHLCELILSGDKTSTWRLFDDKDLQVGDQVQLLNKETLQPIGVATLTSVVAKPLGDVTDAELQEHQYESAQAMYDSFRTYYGDRVGPDSAVKIIQFSFEKV